MLTRDEMPEDNADLVSVRVEFRSVSARRVVAPEAIVPDMLDYLAREGFPPDSGLRFLRNALVEERALYLIWEFETGGERAFATAAMRDRQWCLGCGLDHWGLSPEQYILADFHNCL